MKLVREPSAISELTRELRAAGQTIGFVPTMGALHEGHLSLVRLARRHCDKVVVSIFVNPTQFAPNEDYLRYPRHEHKDLAMLEQVSTDVVYLPTAAQMYAESAAITVDRGPVGMTFEGQIRPTHFRGVLTVVAKLFHQVQPHTAIFGQKDAQQLFLIRQMVHDLNFPVTVIEGETAREADGLAMSSRNAYLKVSERKTAPALYHALTAAKAAFVGGVLSLVQLQVTMQDAVATHHSVAVEYLTAVDENSFIEVDPMPDDIRLIGAVRVGSVRLIDNLKASAA